MNSACPKEEIRSDSDHLTKIESTALTTTPQYCDYMFPIYAKNHDIPRLSQVHRFSRIPKKCKNASKMRAVARLRSVSLRSAPRQTTCPEQLVRFQNSPLGDATPLSISLRLNVGWTFLLHDIAIMALLKTRFDSKYATVTTQNNKDTIMLQ